MSEESKIPGRIQPYRLRFDEEPRYEDWYQDDNGRIFEYRFDKYKNKNQWFEIDPQIVGYLKGREVKPPRM
jgi:hypothetical protein